MSYLDGRLILADGTVLENSRCGFADGTLWCWISGLTMADCFSIFSNPDNVRTITRLYQTVGYRYTGFINIDTIKRGTDGLGNDTIDVKLTPNGNDFSIEEFPIEPIIEEGGVTADA